jgi:signal peptidase II
MRFILLSFVVILLDYISKYYIKTVMAEGVSIPVVDGVFHITYVLNSGAAFGLLANQRGLFIGAAFVLLAVLLGLLKQLKKQSFCLRIGFSLIAGGALGNLIDRVNVGQVVDFLDFRVWPVFNIADAAICIGAGCVLWCVTKNKDFWR